MGGGDRGGGLDAVQFGHPDVHEHDVGIEVRHQRDGLRAVARLADDVDVVRVVQDHPQSGAHEGLVVGDDHPDRHVGRVARTANPRSGRGPASKVPPRTFTRSRIPSRPCPVPDGCSATTPSSVTSISSVPGP